MSVSRINQLVNVFILAVWVLLALHAAWPIGWLRSLSPDTTISNKYAIFAILSVAFVVLIVWLGRTGEGNQVHAATKRESRILD